jgi:GNAT superfamily N-acetyltransferase
LLLTIYGSRLVAFDRFAFSDEALELEHLKRLSRQVPDGFAVRRIDLNLARRIVAEGSLLVEGHVGRFLSPEDFVRRGVGFCVLHGRLVVSGASSYAICSQGIEIQIDTHPDYRRRGLATVVAATLISHCLERGLAAHWDAANPVSAALARKLGYTLQGSYEMLVRVW